MPFTFRVRNFQREAEDRLCQRHSLTKGQKKSPERTHRGDIRALDLKPLASGLLFFYDMISIFFLTPNSKGMIT